MFLIILIAGIKHVEMTQHMCSGLRISFLGLGVGRTQGERSGGLAFISHPLFPPFLIQMLPPFSCLFYALELPSPAPFLFLFYFSLHHNSIQGAQVTGKPTRTSTPSSPIPQAHYPINTILLHAAGLRPGEGLSMEGSWVLKGIQGGGDRD